MRFSQVVRHAFIPDYRTKASRVVQQVVDATRRAEKTFFFFKEVNLRSLMSLNERHQVTSHSFISRSLAFRLTIATATQQDATSLAQWPMDPRVSSRLDCQPSWQQCRTKVQSRLVISTLANYSVCQKQLSQSNRKVHLTSSTRTPCACSTTGVVRVMPFR